MYDALGFEISAVAFANTEPDFFPPHPENGAYILGGSGGETIESATILTYDDNYSHVGEPLVLPDQDDYVIKSGADDDWLTPLSNGEPAVVDDVVVIGRRFTPTPGSYYNPYDYGEWDGHDTSQTEPPYVPDELPDCVSAQPAIIDEDYFVKVVKYLTEEFKGAYNHVPGNQPIDSSRYEYGVLIYELNGQIGHGDIQTSNNPGEVDITLSGVPDGARIIAWMHNHPDGPEDDRVPSYHNGGDWDQHRDLINGSYPRGITVDPNLLLVLYSNQDGRTRVYDNNDRDTRNPSCPI